MSSAFQQLSTFLKIQQLRISKNTHASSMHNSVVSGFKISNNTHCMRFLTLPACDVRVSLIVPNQLSAKLRVEVPPHLLWVVLRICDIGLVSKTLHHAKKLVLFDEYC